MVTLKSDGQSYVARFPIIKGVLVALTIQFVLILLLAVLFHFSSLSDHYLSLLSIVVVTVGVLSGGMSAAKAAEARFLLNGLGVGLTCLVIVFLWSLLGGNGIDPAELGVRALSYLGAGTVGGMLGALTGK